MTHTPGPWKIDGLLIIGAESGPIARMTSGANEANGYNARLIAAAPDMLRACQAVIAYHDSNFPENREEMLRIVLATIAKATGE